MKGDQVVGSDHLLFRLCSVFIPFKGGLETFLVAAYDGLCVSICGLCVSMLFSAIG